MATSHHLSASARSSVAPPSATNDPIDCAAALFSYDFVSGGVDYDTLEQLHRGDISEWTTALRRSGLFTDAEMDDVTARWVHQPVLLLDALLRDADEMTTRRCRLAWASMDRLAPFQMPIAHIG